MVIPALKRKINKIGRFMLLKNMLLKKEEKEEIKKLFARPKKACFLKKN